MPIIHHCKQCSTETVLLRGSIYNDAIVATGTQGKYKKSSKPNSKVSVCPNCDAYMLGIERTDPCLFKCRDGIERFIDDFDFDTKTFNSHQ